MVAPVTDAVLQPLVAEAYIVRLRRWRLVWAAVPEDILSSLLRFPDVFFFCA
jgi:hypothetical protein